MIGQLPEALTFILSELPEPGGWIDDFGLVLAAAGLAAAIFHRLRLPVIFGYILAGILIGPHLFASPLVKDAEAIQQISELGVIFLLFFIGMEFDLKRLQRVLGPALMGLFMQTLFMLYLAQLLAPFLGWSSTSTLFFGSLLAISSSMVSVRLLRDSGRNQEPDAQFTIGILILEDILAVILLVILTGVAVTQTFDWDAAWLVTFLMGLFVIMVFAVGRALVPRLLQEICGEESNQEVLTVVSVGLVMAVSILALRLEFSPALGAFVAGTLLSQTGVSQMVERMNRSLHDVFAAVFFVSVGMLLQPALIVEHLEVILLVSLLVILAKLASCWVGLALAGQRGRTAFLASAPKAQIGEFSFIIATLGNSLGVMDEGLTAIAFGVALVTILLSPPLTFKSPLIYDRLVRVIPRGVQTVFEAYQKFIEGLMMGLGRNLVLRLIRRPVLQVTLYFFLISGIFVSSAFASSWINLQLAELPGHRLWRLVYWLLTGLVLSPFILAVVRNLNAMAYILTDALFGSRPSRPIYQNRLRQVISAGLQGGFLTALATVVLLVAAPYLPTMGLAVTAFLLVTVVVVFLRSRFILVNSQMEILFMESFRAEVASREEQRRLDILRMIQNQAPWPVEIADVILPAHAAWSGRLIRDLALRARFGVNVLALGRGYSVVYDPSPDAPVFSGDRLVVSGSPEAVEQVRTQIQQQVRPEDRAVPSPEQFRMERVYVAPKSDLDGQTLAAARIRQRHGVTVIGIQRGNERITNPAPDFLMQGGDVLIVAGLPERISAFASTCGEKPLPAET